MAERLDPDDVDVQLDATEWRREGDSIVLDREFDGFAAAWEFASAVAAAAERANHHPDILVHGWNRARVTLSTHSAGGITALDLDLAAAIDSIGA